MFLSTLFGVKAVDEADDASTERAYPSRENDKDNAALESVTFTPSLEMPPMPDLYRGHGTEKKTSSAKEDKIDGKEKFASKTLHRGFIKQGQEQTSRKQRKVYICKYCKETFTWATRLQAHLLSHDPAFKEVKLARTAGGDEEKFVDGLEKWGSEWIVEKKS